MLLEAQALLLQRGPWTVFLASSRASVMDAKVKKRLSALRIRELQQVCSSPTLSPCIC